MTSTFFPTLALSALVALSACSREEVEAKMDQAHAKASAALEDLEHVDLSALSPEAIQQKAGEVGDYLSLARECCGFSKQLRRRSDVGATLSVSEIAAR
jgi:hypothetical protein